MNVTKNKFGAWRPSRYTAASTFRCTSSADRTSTSSQPSVTIYYGRRAFAVAGPTMFNTLPDDLRDPAVSIG